MRSDHYGPKVGCNQGERNELQHVACVETKNTLTSCESYVKQLPFTELPWWKRGYHILDSLLLNDN